MDYRTRSRTNSIDLMVIPTRDNLFAPSFGDICQAVDFIQSKYYCIFTVLWRSKVWAKGFNLSVRRLSQGFLTCGLWLCSHARQKISSDSIVRESNCSEGTDQWGALAVEIHVY
ncbi:hypothetical protein HHK36_000919 [Tetracentron sinense]|uniref:Uncharacterized protein n=1 Tax=Tetracentron sinense TaxID=13715 RepID=A0A834ZV04_TETSI|nr:hypothetical protein HHK36_000919 [Tetracentron sinense]